MSDPVTRATAALSSRRSASRARLIVTLDDHGGLMTMSELANECGWDLHRLRSVLFGDEGERKAFSIERSPFALGQVVVYETPHGAMAALTDEGREEAWRLRAEPHWARGRARRHLT